MLRDPLRRYLEEVGGVCRSEILQSVIISTLTAESWIVRSHPFLMYLKKQCVMLYYNLAKRASEYCIDVLRIYTQPVPNGPTVQYSKDETQRIGFIDSDHIKTLFAKGGVAHNRPPYTLKILRGQRASLRLTVQLVKIGDSHPCTEGWLLNSFLRFSCVLRTSTSRLRASCSILHAPASCSVLRAPYFYLPASCFMLRSRPWIGTSG